MTKYEERAIQERKSSMRSSMSLWTAGFALVVVIVMIVGLKNSAPPDFWRALGIGAALIFLLLRQISRMAGSRKHRAVEPDPQSRLNLQ